MIPNGKGLVISSKWYVFFLLDIKKIYFFFLFHLLQGYNYVRKYQSPY